MKARQLGASGFFVALILLLVAVAVMAVYAVSRSAAQNDLEKRVADRMLTIQVALQGFVSANGRLPCPSAPGDTTGSEDPPGGAATCNSPAGTLPWQALGLRRDDSLDPWAARLSYRVFDGPTGLTQVLGASMIDCDTVENPPLKGLDGTGRCRSTQDSTEGEFLAGKGIALVTFGANVSDAAYVLISHGPTGLGSRTSEGGQKVPLPNNVAELANLNAAGPFIAAPGSPANLGPEDANHFDDIVAFARIGDLVRKAGQGGRDWPEPLPPPPISSVTLDAATIAAILGSAPPNGSLGLTGLVFGTALVEGVRITNTARTISFNSNGSNADGIGVGSNQVSSFSNEFLRITFDQKASKLAFTMFAFGTGTSFGTPYVEQVSVSFYDGSTLLGTTVKQACFAGPGSALASFSIDAEALLSAQFDRIELRPIIASGASVNSAFYLSAFATCSSTSATCNTSIADATNTCP